MALLLVAALLGVAAGPARWAWPAGRAAPAVPAANPMSEARVALGRRLFYDADLSADGSMACATCHVQRRAFADGNRTHPGVHGDPGRRNVPGLANVAWARSLTWGDPRVKTLEAQVLIPIAGTDPVEMGMHGRKAEIAARLGRNACYRRLFAAAFPGEGDAIGMDKVTRALAAFQRTLVSDRAPYDRWRAGEAVALDALARKGAAVFARQCRGCHAGPDFTDGRFHALGPLSADAADAGLAEVTGRRADRGRFRTPGLRNVALTAPYLHDGSAATLDAALDRHRSARPLAPADRAAATAFLAALTDAEFVRDPRYALPPEACGAAP